MNSPSVSVTSDCATGQICGPDVSAVSEVTDLTVTSKV